MLEAARAAIANGVNQYPPGRGIPDLLLAIAEHQQRFYGLQLDPHREVLVTAGATEALAATLLALIDGPDDEVVVFEPYYDSYAAVVALTGARLVTVPLSWPDFQPDLDQLRDAVTDRTRIILVNDPHNPTGAVFSRELQDEVIRLADQHDALIVTDEVYEHLVFDAPHVPIATLPGAWERTLTISSGGKTFSTTGWKIGWIAGPADLVDAVLAVKQFLTYVNGAPFQPAIATGLRLPRRVLRRHRPDAARQARPPGRGPARGRVRRVGSVGFVLHRRGCRTARRDGCCRVLPRPARSRRSGRDPADGVRESGAPGGVRDARALRRVQARRGARGCGIPPRRDRRLTRPIGAIVDALSRAGRPSSAAAAGPDSRGAPARRRRGRGGRPTTSVAVPIAAISTPCGSTIIEFPTPSGRRMVGGRDVHRVLDRAGVQQRPPVVLLERAAHPFRRHEEDIRPGVGERAADLGEAQVVAGHEPEPQCGRPRTSAGSESSPGSTQSDSRCPNAS